MHARCVGINLEGRYVCRANDTLYDRVDALGGVPFCGECGERTVQEIVSDFEREDDLIGAARFLDFLERFDEAQAMMERARG